MPTVKDLSRVLRGVSLVMDQYYIQNKDMALHTATNASHHFGELYTLLSREFTDVLSKQKCSRGSSSHEQTPDAAASPSSSSSPSKEAEDLIGFTSIDSSDKASFVQMDAIARENEQKKNTMRARPVPATQMERMFGFGSLAARMIAGKAAQNVAKTFSGDAGNDDKYMDQNAERLAEALCRMRGAALKLGQMLSVQDDGLLPPALSKALERVKAAADYMPASQLEKQMTSQLGSDWKSKLKEFDEFPIAAASIGQVHRAVLLDGTVVAMKIQYPGVATSIHSDLKNLKNLVTYMNVLPQGLFVDEIIKVAGDELSEECDYIAEASHQTRYRKLVEQDEVLNKVMQVPKVIDEFSTEQILTSEYVDGVTIDKALSLPAPIRNAIARSILVLTIKELFEWRFLQSDPNFGNYLYDDTLEGGKRVINLIDFGASREYRKEFVDGYMEVVWAAANQDKDTILQQSIALGFLTGDETPEMMHAHVEAALIVGEPFLTNESFDFGNAQLTKRIGQFGSVFMKYRLTPPPSEAYSLHRKLAGAILLCIRLKANIKCRDILEDSYNKFLEGERVLKENV